MFEQPDCLTSGTGDYSENQEKSMRHTLLREAIRRVLTAPTGIAQAPGSAVSITALAALGLLASPAFAQDAPQDQNS